jgi:hypothetical protein
MVPDQWPNYVEVSLRLASKIAIAAILLLSCEGYGQEQNNKERTKPKGSAAKKGRR